MLLFPPITGQFRKPWLYLGWLFCLCCHLPAQALEKSPTQAAANLENASWPEVGDGKEKSESNEKTVNAQAANQEQQKTDLSTLSDKPSGSISELEQKLKSIYLEVDKKILINSKDIDSQKFLVENYAAGGFETLIKMADLNEKVDKLIQGDSGASGQKPDERQGMNKNLNRLWMLIAIVLVSLIPLAYATGEDLQTAERQPQQTALLVCLSAFIGYFLIGFGLMFGVSAAGWFGLSSPILGEQTVTAAFPFAEFMLYQVSFPILTALIINKAIGHELSMQKSILLAICIGAVVVPVFGHWAAAGRYLSDNSGWLETEGFLDNAGSTTIHSITAWFILVWARKLGAPQSVSTPLDTFTEGPAYSSNAVIFLWLGTLGLATGALSISENQIATAMLNVGLAAAAGALAACLSSSLLTVTLLINRGLGGLVAALAAIGGGAHLLTNMEAILVGVCAGLIYILVYAALRKYLLQQAWQNNAANLIAMHGAGGVWGSLCIGLFGSVGLLAQPKMSQLFAQLEGIFTALVYSVVLANLLYLLFNAQGKDTPR